ncbi:MULTISPECIES: ligase-associated DNA damage response DEXH box helicase [Pseudomonas]|jgi:ATP-dependent Lhr-like helicase|uniref:Ligase-associated DNA damage response DEXH box helicase n=2 Tax=Pseudomonas TaxID=286 RepID=A0ABD4YB97_9PSED|nr:MULTISPECIES: ligase-associated DNA damage response DEXH box helicase [Pseudomonas]MBA6121447.1 ligase-associated DNA damage response DEXH box helicase [Pseudomonas juntendi]MBI6914747.1 ligase-associated DNA damage response DEXH box helicase [Pseudomonas juntendi]MCF3157019.1 ligase-associated DNA damage response DEXH box helicase [Pseudomonas juntendi]MCQ1990878.1 ligase-associated DNA damage response DEXH box helicase [Pseudomonas sp. Eb3]MDG9888737.1 ligase-associated DNA damage respons
MPTTDLANAWFSKRGWKPFAFQRRVWAAVERGESGLLHASTGAGKTYAVWLAALRAFKAQAQGRQAAPLQVIWITPMRALAADTARALQAPLDELGLPWSVGVRSGDTSSAERARQARRLPSVLVTTPESLTLLLTRAQAEADFATLRLIVVDEWHELLGNKRGVQLQLALARLRRWHPGLPTWGLSATLGNLQHARDVLLPEGGLLVQGRQDKALQVDTLLPGAIERFPWAGHMGLKMLDQVSREVDASASCLVFTNTRAQAELWYQALLESRPDWAGLIALHHASLARETRDWVERSLKQGSLKAVICTSSLDLGVDFLPVERVLQIGSAKGIARLMQRAGRSGHAPGRRSRITLVPTHSLELVEAAAARQALEAGHIEARFSPRLCMDVLVQHLVSMALGSGFRADQLLAEVRSTWAFAGLRDSQWQWALDFVCHGGSSLTAYPDYQRVERHPDGVYRVASERLARRHRMGIGTIVSDASLQLKYWSKGGGGKTLGSVEEAFIARLRPGDTLVFAGRVLELVRVENMTAYVRRSTARKAAIARWNGGRMPLSSELADALVEQLDAAAHERFTGPEMRAVRPLLALQAQWSALPTTATLLAETFKSRQGWHLFLYPFAGRMANLGLANLIAWRVSRQQPLSVSIAVNDYGFELLSPGHVDWATHLPQALGTEQLLEDVLASLNAGEMALRRFREIAQIAGLVFGGYPAAQKSMRQIQASSGLFYEVFRKHDAGNLLLGQARDEVLSEELEIDRLHRQLLKMAGLQLDLRALKRPGPLAFALLVEGMRETLSTEKLADRIARMVAELEQAANKE